MLIDTHCHLTFGPLSKELDAVLERARAARVERILCCAYDTASWSALGSLPDDGMIALAFGLHPWAASEPMDEARLDELLRDARAAAVGEIGLDYKVEAVPREVQLAVFRRQLAMAVERDLPVSIHCRGAFEDLIECAGEHGGKLRGVVHAYSRGPELAARLLDNGLHLGFGGALTRPGAVRARKAAARVPLERIVLETDAPSMGMDLLSPEETEPCHVLRVAEALSELKGIDLERVADQTSSNARSLFNI